MSDTASSPIKTRCPACGKKLGFPPAAAGRKAKCPACAHVFRVSADQPAKAAPAPAVARDADGPVSLFDDLAAAEQSAESVQMSQEEAAMAQAAAQAARAAGHVSHAGVAHTQGSAAAQSDNRPAKAVRGSNEPDASFFGKDGMFRALVRGILSSIAGALVVDVIWYLIAKAMAGYSPGFMPLFVGMGAGLGMTLGIRSETKIAGILAVVITWVGISVGEVAIVVWLVYPKAIAEAKVVEEKIENQRHVVYDYYLDKAYAESPIPAEKRTKYDNEEIEKKGRYNFGKLTDDQVRAEYKKVQKQMGTAPPPKLVPTLAEALSSSVFNYAVVLCSIGALIMAFFVGSGILGLGIE